MVLIASEKVKLDLGGQSLGKVTGDATYSQRADEMDNEMSLPVISPTHDQRATPARLQRLGNITVNHLGAAGVDIEIEIREDGRIAIVMPPEWASLHLASLQAQAVAFEEKLQRSTWELKQREAELRVQTEEGRRRIEELDQTTYAQYKRYRKAGFTHHESLHKLKGRESGWSLVLLNDVIRKQRTQENLEKWRAVVEKLRHHREAGLTIPQIANKEGLTPDQVKHALRRDGPPQGITRGSKEQREQRWERIIELARQGLRPSEIAEALDLSLESVSHTVSRWKRDERAGKRRFGTGRQQKRRKLTATD